MNMYKYMYNLQCSEIEAAPNRFYSFWSHDPMVRQLIQFKMFGEWHELELKIENF